MVKAGNLKKFVGAFSEANEPGHQVSVARLIYHGQKKAPHPCGSGAKA